MKVELKHNAEGKPRVQIKISRKQAQWLEEGLHNAYLVTVTGSEEELFLSMLKKQVNQIRCQIA